MKPVMQTRLSNPEGTVHGNCFTACVASILEKAVEDIPDMQGDDGKWFKPFFDTITAHGLEYRGSRRRWWYLDECGPKKEDPFFFKDFEAFEGVDGFVIVAGPSPRDYVTRGHACVYKAGKLAHDPHPSGMGLKNIEYFYLLTKAE